MLVAIASTHGFPSKLIEFVFAFPQADIDVYVFMYISLVIRIDWEIVEWVLTLNKSIYGIKQVSASWFDPLKPCLEITVCYWSQVDPCEFNINFSAILSYVDYCVLVSHKQETKTSSI